MAQVGNVNYANITDAFAAVKQSNGGTLTLLANCKTPNTSEKFDISGNYTLDLNGCTLTGWLNLSETSMSLTVKDSGTNGKIQATGSWPALWADGGDVTIESGTLATETETGKALVFGYKAACGTLTIKGGVFETGYVQIGDTGGTTVITGGAFHDLRVNGDYSKRVTLSGGTFDTVKRYNGSTIAPTDLLADGYTFVDRDTGAEVSTSQEPALTNVKVVSEKTANASASLTVDGTDISYGTFEEALTAAQQTRGGTLTWLDNVNLVTQGLRRQRHVYPGLERPYADERRFQYHDRQRRQHDHSGQRGQRKLGNSSKDDTAVWCGGGTGHRSQRLIHVQTFLGIRHRFTSRRGVPLLEKNGWLLAVGNPGGESPEKGRLQCCGCQRKNNYCAYRLLRTGRPQRTHLGERQMCLRTGTH